MKQHGVVGFALSPHGKEMRCFLCLLCASVGFLPVLQLPLIIQKYAG